MWSIIPVTHVRSDTRKQLEFRSKSAPKHVRQFSRNYGILRGVRGLPSRFPCATFRFTASEITTTESTFELNHHVRIYRSPRLDLISSLCSVCGEFVVTWAGHCHCIGLGLQSPRPMLTNCACELKLMYSFTAECWIQKMHTYFTSDPQFNAVRKILTVWKCTCMHSVSTNTLTIADSDAYRSCR